MCRLNVHYISTQKLLNCLNIYKVIAFFFFFTIKAVDFNSFDIILYSLTVRFVLCLVWTILFNSWIFIFSLLPQYFQQIILFLIYLTTFQFCKDV